MTLDPSNPAHVGAIRLACALLIRYPDRAISFTMACEVAAELSLVSVSVSDVEKALAALSSPALSASLLRALLEQCGITVLNAYGEGAPGRHDVGGVAWAIQPKPPLESIEIGTCLMPRLPALILTLLDIPADAQNRREKAMAALKEHGR